MCAERWCDREVVVAVTDRVEDTGGVALARVVVVVTGVDAGGVAFVAAGVAGVVAGIAVAGGVAVEGGELALGAAGVAVEGGEPALGAAGSTGALEVSPGWLACWRITMPHPAIAAATPTKATTVLVRRHHDTGVRPVSVAPDMRVTRLAAT